MSLARTAVERLLLLLFGVARGAFVVQGVAFACASIVVLAVASPESPAWLRGAMISAALLSGTFFVAGLLLIAARRWRSTQTNRGLEPAWPWPALLGLSLVALPGLAAFRAMGLPPLWSRIADYLAASGFWNEAMRPGPSGLVMIPIMLALFVPALVTTAASFSIAFPLAMLPLLWARSRLFSTLLAMGVVCQVALVVTGWIAADAFARLAEQALAAMDASGDAEVLRVADELRRATSVLGSTATALVAPALGMVAWLAFLRPSGAATAFFPEGASQVRADAVPYNAR